MKMLKSKKALSPVVATIILIAVTVAVSLAVAFWMGALTTGFMGSTSITITNVEFKANGIEVKVKNTGTNTVTIASAKVNNSPYEISSLTLKPGDTNTIVISCEWNPGNPYKIDLFDSNGQLVGSYQQNAPG